DFLYMLNSKAVELSGRVLADHLGINPPRFPAGYEVFTPLESAYDPLRVRLNLWGDKGPQAIPLSALTYVPTPAERESWKFPALILLDEIVTRFPSRTVMAFMPAHISAQPVIGSAEAAREIACKAEILTVAR